eukprot:CAMPEP_0203986570 /NCGR_PEP_ID=MMETSP0360-20130528/6122_1 /ASSEMBLY_ACC=CAM_ASM_000342 /TAXON_ID=268821 /ORGANISM="Scrippsiella Hangoei, Strain SHTV-5" /LENGTH=52 /DNA_ID=CAMNT_0050926023 /DNA_START=281 /DNA_END=436 /DNA_ORIENTATION=+
MNLLGHVLEVRGNIVTMWVNGLCEHFEPADQGLTALEHMLPPQHLGDHEQQQ